MSGHSNNGAVLLAAAGGGLARVILRGDASPAEAFAAAELRKHLGAMVGADPERSRPCGGRIVLNDAAMAEAAGIRRGDEALGRETFHIETRGADVHILGGSPRAVLYGAYELLETLGCRWLTPERDLIPHRSRVTLDPICRTAGPAFEYRDLWGSDPDDELWRVRNRFNGHTRNLPERLGGNERYGLWVHTFYELVPPAEFFESHPEYFSLVDGTRRREGAQLCLSNPGVLDVVTERVLRKMRSEPDARYFSVSPNDWFNPCECPECGRAVEETGAQSGPLLRFVNAVAERTNREFPDKLIDTLAYQYTLEAPHGVKVHPNVRVRICPIFCCQAHPFGTCEHPESRRFLTAVQGWSRLTDQLYVWHYFPNFAHVHLPTPNFDELAGNARFYRQNGARGLFWQGERPGESAPLRRYLMARLAWDPERAPWAIVDEWLTGMHGPAAAAALRPYYDLFHGRVREDRSLCFNCVCPPSAPLFDEATLAQADRLLEAARPACREGSALKDLDMLSTGVAYARLWRKAGTFRIEGETYRGDGTAENLAEFDRIAPGLRDGGYYATRFGEDLHVLRARLQSHRVLRLGNSGQSVVAVPSLGGRLVEWQAAGRQWLNPPDPEDEWTVYPYNGGYMECPGVRDGVQSVEQRPQAGSLERGALVLRAELGQGAVSERGVRLADDALEVSTVLRNEGEKPVVFSWSSSWRLQAPDFLEVRVQTGHGEICIRASELPDGLINGRVLMIENAARVAWEVCFPTARLRCECEASAVTQVIVGRCARIGLLAVDVRVAGGERPAGSERRILQRLRICPAGVSIMLPSSPVRLASDFIVDSNS